MKKLTVITLHKSTCDFHSKELKLIFGDIINIESRYLENNLFKFEYGKLDKDYFDTYIDSDLVLVSSHIIFNVIKQRIKKNTEVVIMKRTITLEGLKKLKKISRNKEVMLVNFTPELALEVIAQINEIGIRDINFVPVYPGLEIIPELDIAVTPGELRFIPSRVKKVIDIKNRIIDLSTII
jgi:sigma-54 dependent transcriptional regulator, acetoin dehydrogenase operon transcriptional activator AcoR